MICWRLAPEVRLHNLPLQHCCTIPIYLRAILLKKVSRLLPIFVSTLITIARLKRWSAITRPMEKIMSNMTPREIVSELDKHIIGQDDAKRAVAIALRNRWRRMQLNEELRAEITPKNILMIEPTGVSKTEIALRLAKLADAPFIKVEATKFTEVGYVGRDVESIIRDLADAAIKLLREQEIVRVQHRAEDAAEERILDALLPPARTGFNEDASQSQDSNTRQLFRKRLREGQLDDKDIEIEVAEQPAGIEIMPPPGMEEMTSQLQNLFSNLGKGKKKSRKLKVREA